MPENVAFIMNEITSNDHNRVPEFPANSDLVLSDRRASAKTGTGENFTSNWTVGWTPQLATVVYVGNPDPSCLGDPSKVTPAMLRRMLLEGLDEIAVTLTMAPEIETSSSGLEMAA